MLKDTIKLLQLIDQIQEKEYEEIYNDFQDECEGFGEIRITQIMECIHEVNGEVIEEECPVDTVVELELYEGSIKICRCYEQIVNEYDKNDISIMDVIDAIEAVIEKNM